MKISSEKSVGINKIISSNWFKFLFTFKGRCKFSTPLATAKTSLIDAKLDVYTQFLLDLADTKRQGKT